MMNILLDSESQPTTRQVIGALLSASSHADIAVRSVRLAALDLRRSEVERVTRCRVLLGSLDANALVFPAAVVARPDRFRTLLDFIASERVEIRSAGMGSWLPDFSIYRAADFQACLLGAHYFHAPAAEPAFTCVLRERAAVERAADRFERLWSGGHDVRDAVLAAVRAAEATVA